jgi:fructose-specific phosphotransferase system IIC component
MRLLVQVFLCFIAGAAVSTRPRVIAVHEAVKTNAEVLLYPPIGCKFSGV